MADQTRIHVVGLGVSEIAELSSAALAALLKSDVIIGSNRQLITITPLLDDSASVELQELPKLSELKNLLNNQGDKQVCVLASGDPLFYGIGRWFCKHFEQQQLQFYPAVSSVQAACHELGLALQDVDVLSLHGRPLEKIRTQLKNNQTLLVLTDKHSGPQKLANECQSAGYEDSTLWVCEKMGYGDQRIRQFTVAELLSLDELIVDPLHVTVIKTAGQGGVLPQFPGIPDAHYETGAEPGKGMITKREVRLSILSLLQPSNGDVIWDIGAGCGGVSVELAYWNQNAHVYAVECHKDRLKNLHLNREKFGVLNNLHIIEGQAPQCLDSLPSPTKVFIGGSGGELAGILDQAWEKLPLGGVLVASTVTDSSKDELITFSNNVNSSDNEIIELAVSKAALENVSLNYQHKKPVMLFKLIKNSRTT